MPANEDTFEITGDEVPAGESRGDEQNDEEKKFVKALAKEYAIARKFDEDSRTQYGVDRRYASGAAVKAWASTANLIGSFIDILTSFLYAKDPDVSVVGAKNVGGTAKDNADVAETLGIVITRLWRKAKLKKAARKLVRSSLSVGPGWLKVIMTHQTRTDPVVKAKLNDLEDNMRRLEATRVTIDENEGELTDDEIQVKMQDMLQLQKSLSAKLEVAYRWGLAVDFVNAEDMQVSLDVSDLSDHLDADWNSNEIYVLTSELRAKFPRLTKADVKAADIYYQRKKEKPADETEVDMGFTAKDAGRYTKSQSTEDGTEPTFARVIEVWDNRDNHIKTIISGVGRWAIEPYMPPYASTRFFPYFNLSLFEVDGSRHPQSLSDRLKKLQDEYSSKRSNSRLAAERSIPGIIFDSTGITPTDMKKIEQAVSQEYVGINPTKGDDIRKLFTEKPIAKVDPLVFDTRPVLSDMERIAGVQEALSQSTTSAKTATEAKIQQTGFTSRTGADRDTLEDVLNDLAWYTAELSIQALPIAFVQRIAGEKAFWPEGMDVEDLLTLAEVEIKAGTTGKPDEDSLRQSWQVLLPLAQDALVSIQEAQVTGNIPLAVAIKNLIAETMRRLDERIDVDMFIPAALPDISAAAAAIAGNVINGAGAAPPGPVPGPAGNGQAPEDAAAEANTLA